MDVELLTRLECLPDAARIGLIWAVYTRPLLYIYVDDHAYEVE